jgi:hypothetical protein
MNNNFPTDPMDDLDARRAWDVVDYCDLIVSRAIAASGTVATREPSRVSPSQTKPAAAIAKGSPE